MPNCSTGSPHAPHDVGVTSSAEKLLDQMYYAATDERDKGDRFERFMRRFFEVDKVWSSRFSSVVP